nr:DUF2062 domain-containing protein [Shinella daejeonensis]
MLFRRKKQPRWQERVREFLWPRKGLTRPLRYLAKRILRLSASPHSVAAGVAAGTFSAFTPLFGFHALLALALAWLLSGNLIAAVLATAIANPVTIPIIMLATLRVGEGLLGGESARTLSTAELLDRFEHLRLSELWAPLLKPMFAGSLTLGFGAASVAYGGTRIAVSAFATRRRARILARAALPPAHSTTGAAPLPPHGDDNP